MTADLADLPKINEAIILQPGDRVIFTFATRLTQTDAERIGDMIQAKMGKDFPFVVTGEGIDVTVYRGP